MIGKATRKPLAAAVGAAIVTTLAAMPAANAEENPFGMTSLTSGYMVAEKEGKCGEAKCGEGKGASAKKSEGKCGESKAHESKCGESKAHEGKCGESKAHEGKCGDKK
jgi:uncharacterized low-complexity protein